MKVKKKSGTHHVEREDRG